MDAELFKERYKTIDDAISSVEKSYGISIETERRYECISTIFKQIFYSYTSGYKADTGNVSEAPEEVNIRCVDGTIRKVKVSLDLALSMLSLREKCKVKHMTRKDYENILVDYGGLYTYCDDTKKEYMTIENIVGAWLMKHNMPAKVFDICCGVLKLGYTYGYTVEVYDRYLKSCRGLRSKAKTLGLDEQGWDLNSRSFEWDYTVKTVALQHMSEGEFKKFKVRIDNTPEEEDEDDLKLRDARKHNIIWSDYLARVGPLNDGLEVRYPMSSKKALGLGIKERDKYGFVFERNSVLYERENVNGSIEATNYNLTRYIKYLAEQEGITVGKL